MTSSRAADFETPLSRSGSQTLPNTVAHGISVGSWKTKPISRFGLARGIVAAFGQSTVPEVASPSPAMIRSAVDLPQPDGPSRLTNSRSPTSSDMFLQRHRAVGEDLGHVAQRDQRRVRGGPPVAGDGCGLALFSNGSV